MIEETIDKAGSWDVLPYVQVELGIFLSVAPSAAVMDCRRSKPMKQMAAFSTPYTKLACMMCIYNRTTEAHRVHKYLLRSPRCIGNSTRLVTATDPKRKQITFVQGRRGAVIEQAQFHWKKKQQPRGALGGDRDRGSEGGGELISGGSGHWQDKGNGGSEVGRCLQDSSTGCTAASAYPERERQP